MRSDVDANNTADIPEMFCWTKYGTEAGEDAAAILARKEAERQANAGVFLWGIGNAIGPSIESLLENTSQPQVVFTPTLTKAAAHDIAPSGIAVWRSGVGLDGSHYVFPAHSHVTSRVSPTGRAHYALVCRSTTPLVANTARSASFAVTHVQNLRSGSRVGASQVTSVVRRIACALGLLQSGYKVSFTADLVAPYLVQLTENTITDDEALPARGVPHLARPGRIGPGEEPDLRDGLTRRLCTQQRA